MLARYIKRIGITYIFFILSFIFSFYATPLMLNYFGVSLYGVVSVVTTSLNYLALCNFGIPLAAGVVFAKLNNHLSQQQLIKNSLVLLIIISSTVLFGLLIINHYYPNWVNFIGITTAVKFSLIKGYILISLIFFIIKIPLFLFAALLVYIKKTHIAKMLDTLNSLATLVAILIVIYFKNSLTVYAYIYGSLTFVIAIITTFTFYTLWNEQKSNSKISATDSNLIQSKYILKSGFHIFMMNIGGMVIWNTDNLVISHNLDLKQVAIYSLIFKLFLPILMLSAYLQNFLNPLLIQYYQAKDSKKLDSLYKLNYYFFTILGGLVFIFFLLVYKDFLHYWLHRDDMFVGYGTIGIIALYAYIFFITLTPFNAITILGYTRNLYKITLIEAIINLSLSLYLVKHIGIAGVALGTLIAHILTSFIFAPLILKKATNNLINNHILWALKHAIFALIPVSLVGYVFYYKLLVDANIILKLLFITIISCLYLIASFLVVTRKDRTNIFNFIKKRPLV